MFDYRDLFQWDRFITPSIIKVFYWLAVGVSALFGLSGIISGLTLMSLHPLGGVLWVIGSLIGIVIGVVTVTLMATAIQGLDRAFHDAISFLGSVNWVINDQWALYVSNSTGPERTDNNSDYRTTWDGTLFFTPAKDFTAAGNVYYVWEAGGAADGSDAQLYALALLAAYQLDPMFTLKGRVEWIHDGDNYRLGPVNDIYEATVGLTIKPFPNDQWGSNVKFRAEIRWDHSPDAAFPGDANQLTFGIDVVVTF